MRGCLFTLLLGAIVLAFVVVVGLPALAGAILAAGLSSAGLVADDTAVTVSSDPPTDLLGLRADTVRVTATDATYRGMRIGALDLVLGDVRLLERHIGGVDGELRDVGVQAAGDRPVVLDRVTLLGGGSAIVATTLIAEARVQALVAGAVEAELGVRPSLVRLVAPDRVVIQAGATLTGRLAVTRAGSLVARMDGASGDRTVVLVRGGEDLPIELRTVLITQSGDVRLDGDLVVDDLG